MGCCFQALPIKGDKPLIARHVRALINGKDEVARAEQGRGLLLVGMQSADPRGIETSISADAIGRFEIDDKHVDRAVRPCLQLETPFEFQGRAKQDRQRHRFTEQA